MGNGETKVGVRLRRVLETGARASPEIREFRGFDRGEGKMEN